MSTEVGLVVRAPHLIYIWSCLHFLVATSSVFIHPPRLFSCNLRTMKLCKYSIITCAVLLDHAQANALPKPLRRRQMSGSMPYSLSGFDDPTIDIIDGAFNTAMEDGYPGVAASYQNQALTGPVDLLQSSTSIYGVNPAVTLPLYTGMSSANKPYWWILTDTSDQGNAEQLGLNYSPKLRFSAQSNTTGGLTGAEQLMIVNNTIAGRVGMIDFTPVRNIVPGDAAPFPPKSVQPGSVGDSNYTPLIQLMNAGGEVWNAPIVAGECTEDYLNQFCNGVPMNMSTDFYSKGMLVLCSKTVTSACSADWLCNSARPSRRYLSHDQYRHPQRSSWLRCRKVEHLPRRWWFRSATCHARRSNLCFAFGLHPDNGWWRFHRPWEHFCCVKWVHKCRPTFWSTKRRNPPSLATGFGLCDIGRRSVTTLKSSCAFTDFVRRCSSQRPRRHSYQRLWLLTLVELPSLYLDQL